MQRRITLAFLVVAGFLLAACGAEAPPVIPTEIILPTLAPTQEQTEESTPPADPTETVSAVSPSIPPLSPTMSPTENAEAAADLPVALPEDEESLAAVLWLVREGENAPVYDCPSTNCAVMTTLEAGMVLEVIDEGPQWHQIRLEEDAEGYIEVRLLRLSSPGDGAAPPASPFEGEVRMGEGADLLAPPDVGGLPPGVVPGSGGTIAPPEGFTQMLTQTAEAP